MSISSSEASLRAVRQDLDLSANGPITDRAVMNKVNKQSTPVSLADFRGNLLGQQLLVTQEGFGDHNVWNKKRDVSSAHHYISTTGGSVAVSGNKILCTRKATGIGSGDNGVEARVLGFVDSGMAGTYRVTGNYKGGFQGRSAAVQMHILLLSHTADYLAGNQTIHINEVYDGNSKTSGTEYSFNQTADLVTGSPYITLILRNITRNGSEPSGTDYIQEFWDFKVQKV